MPGPASNPGPSDGATGVNVDDDLVWTAGSDTISHDVYFNGAFQGNQAEKGREILAASGLDITPAETLQEAGEKAVAAAAGAA